MTFESVQISVEDVQRWNNLLYKASNGSYRASIAYEYSKGIIGRETTTYIFSKNNIDVAGVHYSKKKILLGFASTADIISGIIFIDIPTEELTIFILNHFVAWAKATNASFASYNPWIPQIIGENKTNYSETILLATQKSGFVPLNKGRHTYWIDLTLPEDELLSNMKRQTRYEITRAIRSDLQIDISSSIDDDTVDKFWFNYSKLGKSKGFTIMNEKRFKQEVITLVNCGIANLYTICYQGVVINYSLASKFGTVSYLHGAINQNFKNLEGCPSPGQIAQWKMITASKQMGLETYDLGFCPGPVPQPEHPAYSIWKFKFGFGGKPVQFLPTFGIILNPLTGLILRYLKYRK